MAKAATLATPFNSGKIKGMSGGPSSMKGGNKGQGAQKAPAKSPSKR